jgi:hypothetical protein
MYQSLIFSVQTLKILHAGAYSMMDGGAANFGAAQVLRQIFKLHFG